MENHVIRRQILEFELPRQVESGLVQRRLSQIVRRRFVPILDRFFSRAKGVLLQIDQLNLDLGPVRLSSLERDLVVALETALHRALPELDRSTEDITSKRHESESRERDPFALLTFYFKTGRLPWWQDLGKKDILRTNLNQVRRQKPGKLRQKLREWLADANSRQRLVLALDDGTLLEFASLIVPNLPRNFERQIADIITLLQPVAAGRSTGQIRFFIWTKLFQMVTSSPQRISKKELLFQSFDDATLTGFMRGFLPNLPREFEEQVGEMIALLQSMIGVRDADQIRFQIWQALIQNVAAFPEKISDSELLFQTLTEAFFSTLNKHSPMPVKDFFDLVGRKRLGLSPSLKHWLKAQASHLAEMGESSSKPLNRIENMHSTEADQEPKVGPDRPQGRSGQDPRRKSTDLPTDPSSPKVQDDWDETDVFAKGRFHESDCLYVENAGLVLLWPFLPQFFRKLDLVEEASFRDDPARHRAVNILGFLASGNVDDPEFFMPLNKVLCGLALDEVLMSFWPVNREEEKASAQLLEAVIAQGQIHHHFSVSAFREAFLLRKGKLSTRDGVWLLQVERQNQDLLMERFPWPRHWLKLPWMESAMQVEW